MFKATLLIAASVSALRIQDHGNLCGTMTCGTDHNEACPPCDTQHSEESGSATHSNEKSGSATATAAHEHSEHSGSAPSTHEHSGSATHSNEKSGSGTAKEHHSEHSGSAPSTHEHSEKSGPASSEHSGSGSFESRDINAQCMPFCPEEHCNSPEDAFKEECRMCAECHIRDLGYEHACDEACKDPKGDQKDCSECQEFIHNLQNHLEPHLTTEDDMHDDSVPAADHRMILDQCLTVCPKEHCNGPEDAEKQECKECAQCHDHQLDQHKPLDMPSDIDGSDVPVPATKKADRKPKQAKKMADQQKKAAVKKARQDKKKARQEKKKARQDKKKAAKAKRSNTNNAAKKTATEKPKAKASTDPTKYATASAIAAASK